MHFLFKNKASLYDGKGFEMLTALNQHCHLDSVANAFTTLMLLFSDNMGELEDIMAFHSIFDGMVNDVACCKIAIPLILMVMFFLHLHHSSHDYLLEQFWSCYKPLEGTSLNSIVVDMHYHDELKLVGSDKKVLLARVRRLLLLLLLLLLLINKAWSWATCLRYGTSQCGALSNAYQPYSKAIFVPLGYILVLFYIRQVRD